MAPLGLRDVGGEMSADFIQQAAPRTARALLMDYVALTKPGILRMLLITTFCSMLVAARGLPEWGLVLWTLLGMGLISGSANAMNMVYDQDIDAVMARTAHRPLPDGRLETSRALGFSLLIGLAGFLTCTCW
jgi:protoheme IX farnesyltransferase